MKLPRLSRKQNRKPRTKRTAILTSQHDVLPAEVLGLIRVTENGTLLLRMHNRQVVSAPLGSTLSIGTALVNGEVKVIAVVESDLLSDAQPELKKTDTTDPTSQ